MAVGNKTQRDFDLDLAVEAYLQNQNSNNMGIIIESATGLIYYFISSTAAAEMNRTFSRWVWRVY